MSSACLTARKYKGSPARSRVFLSGKPLEPSRTGTMAIILSDLVIMYHPHKSFFAKGFPKKLGF